MKKTARVIATEGRVRTVIEGVTPCVDGGRFAMKRIVGDRVEVEADCFADGHEQLACLLLYRREDEAAWHETPMRALGNDRWRGEFAVDAIGVYRYTVTAWVDPFLSWRHDFARRVDPEDVRNAARAGADLVAAAAARASGKDAQRLDSWAQRLRTDADPASLSAVGQDDSLAALAAAYPDRRLANTHAVELRVTVDRARARYGASYELSPRSRSPTP